MKRLSVLAAALLLGCNPLVLLSESPSLGGGAREALIELCCECLVEERVELPEESPVGCPVADAGPPSDGGAIGAAVESPCLCGDQLDACMEKLASGGSVVVVGACVRRDFGSDGPCAASCEGVLAYPQDEGELP